MNVHFQLQDLSIIPNASDPRLNTAKCVFQMKEKEGEELNDTVICVSLVFFSYCGGFLAWSYALIWLIKLQVVSSDNSKSDDNKDSANSDAANKMESDSNDKSQSDSNNDAGNLPTNMQTNSKVVYKANFKRSAIRFVLYTIFLLEFIVFCCVLVLIDYNDLQVCLVVLCLISIIQIALSLCSIRKIYKAKQHKDIPKTYEEISMEATASKGPALNAKNHSAMKVKSEKNVENESTFYIFPVFSAACFHMSWMSLGAFADILWAFPILVTILSGIFFIYILKYYSDRLSDKKAQVRVPPIFAMFSTFVSYVLFVWFSARFFFTNEYISALIIGLLGATLGLIPSNLFE